MTADIHNILPAIPRHTIFCHITFCPRHPAAKRPARDTTSCHETSHHARFRYVISATFGAKTKRTNFADKYIEQKKDDCAKYTIIHYGNFHSTKCHNLQHIFSSPVDNFLHHCFFNLNINLLQKTAKEQELLFFFAVNQK